MNEFKFGDKVQCPDMSLQFVVNRNGQETLCVDRQGNFTVYHCDDLELTPHPDTIQLNALKDKISKLSDVSFTCNLCGEDNEISSEIQDIIDFAITEEQADD